MISVGQKFGRWTVLSAKESPHYHMCLCECGTKKKVYSYSLTNGSSLSCGCLRKEITSNLFKGIAGPTKANHPNWSGSSDIPGRYWGNLIRNANRRHIPVDITIDQAQLLFDGQKRKCALTGRPIGFGSSYLGIETSASLDRIDSSKSYSIENCQWLHKQIQVMKNRYDQAAFIQACREVSLCASK